MFMVSIRKVGCGITNSLPMFPTSNCAVQFASPEMFGGLDMAIFCRQKDFITLPRRKENTAEDWAAGPSISKRNRIWKHTDESVRVVEEAIIEQQIIFGDKMEPEIIYGKNT